MTAPIIPSDRPSTLPLTDFELVRQNPRWALKRLVWCENRIEELEAALARIDDLGIYPRCELIGQKEIPRTEWQNGWNAALIAVAEAIEEPAP